MKFRSRPHPPALAPTEVRDPTAATRTLRWTSPGQAQISDWDATRAIGLAYYGNVFVYRCVECIANDVASLPIRVGPDPDRPDDYNPKAPLAIKLAQAPPGGPAPGIAARKLWAWSTGQRAITGKLAWEIERGAKDRPVAFWPLPGGMLDAIPSTSGTSYFQGFKFGPMGKQRFLRPEQVYYAWRPGQSDWRQPESVLQSARIDVSVAVMMGRYNYAFLKNDARPAAVVVHQAFAETDERDAWRGKFLSEHEGPDQAGKPIFVEVDAEEGGNVATMLDVKTLGLSQRDARFVELYAGTIRAITVAFGVPLSRLGDASERTFSNAGEEMDMYWGSTIPSWTTELADDINISLAPQFGDDLVMWFDFSRQTKGRARIFQAASPVELVMANIVTADEVRHDLGLVPRPEEETEPVPEPAPPPALPAAASASPPEVRHIPSHEERRAGIYKAVSRQVKALERVWERQWRTMFRRQERTTLSRLTGRRGHSPGRRTAPDASAVFDRSFWESETVDFSAGLYEAVFEVGGSRVADLFGLDFTMEAPYVEKAIKARANQLAGQVTDTTYAAIKDALAAGAKAGESIPELAARVRHVFGVASTSRATTIARTEVLGGFNQSSSLVARELGSEIVAGKEWIATLDQNTRPDHAEANGQIVGIDEKFTVGGEEMDYPDAPNCRCTVAMLTPEEMSGRSSHVPRTNGHRTLPVGEAERRLVLVHLGKMAPEEMTA